MNLWKQMQASLHNEVSAATIKGFLNSASVNEGIQQDADRRLQELLGQGMPPWEAYAKAGYALAYVNAARAYIVFAQELVHAEEEAHPDRIGFLPRVTEAQAMALCQRFEPTMEEAVIALKNAQYVPQGSFPLDITQQRIEESDDERPPLAHLQGLLNAARKIRLWADGPLAQYQNALNTATTPVPEQVRAHVEQMSAILAKADFHLQTTESMLAQMHSTGVTLTLHKEAEGFLWEAMAGCFTVSQLIASPMLAEHHPSYGSNGPSHSVSKHVSAEDLWHLLASDSARADWRAQQRHGIPEWKEPADGEPVNLALEMNELLEQLHGELSADTLRALDEIADAVKRGDAIITSSWAQCPYDPVYQARVPLTIAGSHIPGGWQFHWNVHHHHYRGGVEMAKQFGTAPGWTEELADDH